MSGQDVIRGLIQRGYPEHVAYGIAGNMQVESDGFKTDVNEYAPLVPGSRGGYGLNQWTGPRRRQFEQFAASRGANPADLETQLDFTDWELKNTESRAGNALMQAQTPEEAARIYSEKFLRPGIPHLDRRISAARALAGGGYTEAPAQNALAPVQGQYGQSPNMPPQDNALAPQGPRLVDTRQDVRNFLTPVQAPQYRRFT